MAVVDWDFVPKAEDFVFGGYDAKSCPEKIRKEHDPSYAGIEQDPPTPGDARRMEAGNIREQQVIAQWMAALLEEEVFLIPACDRSAESRLRRGKMTYDLMLNPGSVKVIINARLPQLWDTHRTGEPDALVRGDLKPNGRWVWIPVDMKDHKSLEGTRKGLTWKVSSFAKPYENEAQEKELYPGIPQKVDALQLAHYHRMLESLGFENDAPVGAIIGRESELVWHDLSQALYNSISGSGRQLVSAIDYYDKAFAERLEIAKAAKKGVALCGPEWKQECTGCPFRTACHDELKIDLDHITLLPGVTPGRAKVHYSAGVETVAELSRLHHPTALLVDAGVDVSALIVAASREDAASEVKDFFTDAKPEHLQACADVGIVVAGDVKQIDPRTARYSGKKPWRLADTIDQARVAKIGKVHRPRGVPFLDVPRARIEQDIDIEDAPAPDGSGNLVYMIGVRDAGYSERDGENVRTRTEYHCFADYTGTEAGEARVFSEFWDHITTMRALARGRRYGYRAYHYTQHEDAAFRMLAEKHAGKPGIPALEEVNEFLESKFWVDLYPVVSTQLIWPTESLTLKDVAKWVRFSWRDSDPGGGNSITWYEDAVSNPDPAVRLENQRRLEEYNADDCHAQLEIRDWISRFGETRQPGKRLPSVEVLDKRFYRRRQRS